ncbi:MAG TPA: molybdopterin-dependent oxidoreductase, partial [Dehalococcoidia bacterium]
MSLFARRQAEHEKYGERLPPGQKQTEGWPVLHYGGIPNVDLASWRFEIAGLVEEPVSFTWENFMALPQASLTNDIHCVTTWSKFDNVWTGVPVAEVLKRARPKPEAKHAMVHSYGGYTTNLSLDDLNREGNLFAHTHNGQPLTKEHGWP